MRRTRSAAVAVMAVVVAALCTWPVASPLAGQSRSPAAVPFGPGERAEYSVTLGVMGEVGRGKMEVVGIEMVHGHPTYHLQFEVRGRVAMARVDNNLESWLDVNQLFARRIHKRQREVRYEADRRYDFLPDSMIYRRVETGATDRLASSLPLDEVSFLYFVRTLPLEVGQTYTFDRYYKESGNPVVLRVLRRDTLKGPGGVDVPVIVVRPIIRTSGLFGEGGEAEVFFTDDHRRILVRMTSRVPVLGRLGLTLTGYTPGTQLVAGR